jgi:hypothetical protein
MTKPLEPQSPGAAGPAELSLDTLDQVVGGAGSSVRPEDAT